MCCDNSYKSLFLGLDDVLARLSVVNFTLPSSAAGGEKAQDGILGWRGENKTPGSKRRKTDRFVRMIEAVHSFTFNIFLQRLGWYAGSCQFSAENKSQHNFHFIFSLYQFQ